MDDAQDMLNQLWEIYKEERKNLGNNLNDLGDTTVLDMLTYIACIGDQKELFLVNQYIEKVGGIDRLIKYEMAALKERYIDHYFRLLKRQLDKYYIPPRGWYQGEPYWN